MFPNVKIFLLLVAVADMVAHNFLELSILEEYLQSCSCFAEEVQENAAEFHTNILHSKIG